MITKEEFEWLEENIDRVEFSKVVDGGVQVEWMEGRDGEPGRRYLTVVWSCENFAAAIRKAMEEMKK